MQLRLVHLERDDVPIYEKQEEHPFTHVFNPQKIKVRIEKTEEQIRTGVIPETHWGEAMIGLADDCAELRQYEKAISSLAAVMRRNNQPDSVLLNKMALYAGSMGDIKREEKVYRGAIEADPDWSTPWFNLALNLRKQNRFEDAREAINTAIKVEPGVAPYYILQAQLAKQNGKDFAINTILDLADSCAFPLDEQNSWELHWSIVAADMRGEKKTVEKIRKLRQRKVGRPNLSKQGAGCLPGVYQAASE